ncbi:Glutamate-ammonia-ligase adenylyltransferase [hydrothermal vent metagenome]|uniref:Glutamate-ammonia-ligase adenylyltransferase n=1 Tax=hydrothermal vent metagenome TaxID=652676 RepID=A0A3B0T4M1_9ZZZZ
MTLDPQSLALRVVAPKPPDNLARDTGRLDDLLRRSPGLGAVIDAAPAVGPLLARSIDGSPFLARWAEREPDEVARIFAASPEAGLAAILDAADADMAAASGFETAAAILRQARTRAAVSVSLADLGGVWSVQEVIEALSAIAGRLVSAAVRFLLAAAAETGKFCPADTAAPDIGSGYIVLAMGKLGARELNFSSDIDLIVLYDAAAAPVAEGVEVRRFFVRLTKDLVRLLQEHTGDGYVFRTDLRLRPDPGATHVAISTDAATQYYESFGQNWERAAMIKARALAGDLVAGEAFLGEIQPFIWRKYLDFAAIADVHSIKRQIQAYRGHGDVGVAGHNIKLGRGGIREIEFFVQTQQLIAGGRNRRLRGRKTLEMLDVLASQAWITAEARDEMAAAYRYLRQLENRLQMVADQQTQTLPKDQGELAEFAAFAGYGTAEALAKDLLVHLRSVERHYMSLFEHAPDLGGTEGSLVFTGGEDDPATVETLLAMGFGDAGLISRTIRGWHHGRYAATRTPAARARLTELMPALLRAFAQSEHPDRAFLAFDRFLEGLPAGVQLFALLNANAHLLALLADVLGTAPRLARQLSARPRTLEAVLDPEFYGPLPDAAAYLAASARTLDDAADFEDCLDRARSFGQEQFFRIGVRLLSGTIEASEAGRANSDLATGIVAALLDAVGHEIAVRAGHMPGGEVAVVGMGKLGGSEMTATSDLDLILVYDLDEGATQSDGAAPLSVGQYYSRFAQRFIAAITAPTAEGRLYEVDMRLRPSGRSGPVATRLAAFIDYHGTSSWTWEHMALTRARVLAGSQNLKTKVEAAIRARLVVPRDAAALAGDVLEMRTRIAAEKGTTDIWQIGQVRGGLVDIEFIAQYLQLAHAAENAEILSPNTETALMRLAGAGYLPPDDGEELVGALRIYQTVIQLVRLSLGEPSDPPGASASFQRRLARAVNLPDFAALAAELADRQGRVGAIFKALIG